MEALFIFYSADFLEFMRITMLATLTHDDEGDNDDNAYVESTAAATTTATAATTMTETYEAL